jgi:hypothetical protein
MMISVSDAVLGTSNLSDKVIHQLKHTEAGLELLN